MTACTSDCPVSTKGLGETLTEISTGGPPVPPPPPVAPPEPVPPLLRHLGQWGCLTQFGAFLTFAEATPAIPMSGMLATTVMTTNRAKRLLRIFICLLLLVGGSEWEAPRQG